jgi:alpha-L-fucosidase
MLDDDLHAVDVDGSGRFAALGRSAGHVRSVTRVEADGDVAVGFEQGTDGLTVGRRRHLDRPAPDDAVDIAVYRIELDPPPPAPIELFPTVAAHHVELASVLAGAKPGSIVQLGDGTYVGPARIPDGVTVRGLGPARTVIDGRESQAVSVGRDAHLEHCTLRGGGPRIVWLPKVAAVLSGPGAVMLGCAVDGHVEIASDDCRVISCALTGVVAKAVDRVVVSRSTFAGMNWDCAVEIELGTSHLIESCEFHDLLDAIRLTGTVGATVRGNRIEARWWGVRAVDTESTLVAANSISHTMRAVDIDGGTLAEVTGNAVADGDSGCIIQRGASETTVSGNRWERCRTGLLGWDVGAVRYHGNAIVDPADPDHAVTIGP